VYYAARGQSDFFVRAIVVIKAVGKQCATMVGRFDPRLVSYNSKHPFSSLLGFDNEALRFLRF
jgi:hypothetical protein